METINLSYFQIGKIEANGGSLIVTLTDGKNYLAESIEPLYAKGQIIAFHVMGLKSLGIK